MDMFGSVLLSWLGLSLLITFVLLVAFLRIRGIIYLTLGFGFAVAVGLFLNWTGVGQMTEVPHVSRAAVACFLGALLCFSLVFASLFEELARRRHLKGLGRWQSVLSLLSGAK
jgi:hypothetical protein